MARKLTQWHSQRVLGPRFRGDERSGEGRFARFPENAIPRRRCALPSSRPLFASVRTLAGIGPKTAETLGKLLGQPEGEEARVVDLLFHLPYGVIDRSQQPGIAKAAEGQTVTLRVRVDRHARRRPATAASPIASTPMTTPARSRWSSST